MNFIRQPANWLLKLFSSLAIIGIALLVNSSIVEPHFQSQVIYDDAEIRFSPVRGEDIANYAVRDKQKYLFAASNPEDLNVELAFTRSANLVVSIEPIYTSDSGCSEGGRNEASISFRGDTVNQAISLNNPLSKTIHFSVHKDALVAVTTFNRFYPNCGKALITFEETHNSLYASMAFILVWGLVFLVCLTTQTSTLIAISGAAFNALLLHAETTLGGLNYFAVSVSIALSAAFAGGLFLYSALPFKSKVFAILAGLLVALAFFIPVAFIGHELIFGVPINDESIHAVLQSYLGQVVEFWGQFVGLKISFFVLIGLLLTIFLCLRLNHYKFKKNLSATIGLLLISISAVFVFDRWTDSQMLDLLDRSTKMYRFEISSFERISSQRKRNSVTAEQNPLFKNNTTVFVIGESVNRTHMSAYSYPRKTTPLIDQRIADGNVIKFTNVFSNHTHSNPTISFLLTQANQYNGKTWSESPSILNIAESSAVHSTWFTNHRLLGGWSNYITSIAQDANKVQTINNRIGYGNRANRHDGDLLPLWRSALDEIPNQASFLHFYNSHVDYCGRYPESANQFTDKVTRAVFGEWFNHRKVSSDDLNCYDNSIFYTDQLLEEIVQDLDSKDRPALLVYTADHADDVVQARFHNAVLFTHAMTTIPLFVWANDEWRNQHPDLWENMLKHSNEAFTNDMMFESMAGLIGISEETIDQSYDFSSASFDPPKNLKTIHGRRLVTQESNWHYWQAHNAEYLLSNGISLAAANVDSIAEAKIALDLGVELIQVNTIFSAQNGFRLVDNESNPIGIDLNSFLTESSNEKLDTVLVTVLNKTEFSESALTNALDVISTPFAATLALNETSNINSAPDLDAIDLLERTEVLEHNKSVPLMLNITTQFDRFEQFLPEQI